MKITQFKAQPRKLKFKSINIIHSNEHVILEVTLKRPLKIVFSSLSETLRMRNVSMIRIVPANNPGVMIYLKDKVIKYNVPACLDISRPRYHRTEGSSTLIDGSKVWLLDKSFRSFADELRAKRESDSLNRINNRK